MLNKNLLIKMYNDLCKADVHDSNRILGNYDFMIDLSTLPADYSKVDFNTLNPELSKALDIIKNTFSIKDTTSALVILKYFDELDNIEDKMINLDTLKNFIDGLINDIDTRTDFACYLTNSVKHVSKIFDKRTDIEELKTLIHQLQD